MRKLGKRVLSGVLVVLMICSALVFAPIQTRAAIEYTVMTLDELKTALANAEDGDVINIGYDSMTGEGYANINLDGALEITKDIAINFVSGQIDYVVTEGQPVDLGALVYINSCDVTISGYGQVGTPNNGIYAYQLKDETGDASLTFNGAGYLDDGVLVVDDDSNNYASKLIINKGYYTIPTDRTIVFAFSNGAESAKIPTANLIINGGSFEDDISEYVGENSVVVDNGEDYRERYEVRSNVMSDTFKRMLTDGKIIVPSAEPKTEEAEYAYLMGYLCMFETEEVSFYPGKISDGVFDISASDNETGEQAEIHRVEVEFEADIDSTELKVAEDFAANLPNEVLDSWEWEGEIYETRYSPFSITDLEIVNMWVTGYDRDNLTSHRHTVNYSGELKEYLSNTNVDFRVTMIGAGLDTDLYNEACGDAVILINDIMYAVVPCMVYAQVEHIIYVPDGTATDKDSLMVAAQKRINEYLGSDSKVTISYGGAFNTLSNKWWEQDDAEYQAEMLELLGLETAPEHYFVATAGGMQYRFLIMADSSKMLTPTYKTVDVASNVSISSVSSEIPLDTSIRATQLSNGEEYDKVIETLGVEENVTYDLKLYSPATSNFVSKLENGTFEVKIPISEKLAGKNLVAYYVDENDRVVEYEVTIKDGYAIFETDHFSIYTIAEGNIKEETGGDNTPESKPESSTEVVAPKDNAEDSKKAPVTGDNSPIMIWVMLLAIGGGAIAYGVKRRNYI